MLVIGLATLGLGMLFGGFLGRTLALLPLGILLALGIAASTVFPTVPRDFADTNFVATAGQSQINATNTAYHFDAGLGASRPDQGDLREGRQGGRRRAASARSSSRCRRTSDVTGTVIAQTGDVDAFGQHKGGHNAEVTLTTTSGADGKAGPESVTLDLHLKLGSIKVERG